MLMRSGSFARPRPLVEFDCGSQSTSKVLTSAAASEAARLMAVVVLPTPPFWLATAITRPMSLFSECCGSEYANARPKSMLEFCGKSALECFTWNTQHVSAQVHAFGDVARETHLRTLCVPEGLQSCNIEKCFTWNTLAEMSHNENMRHMYHFVC